MSSYLCLRYRHGVDNHMGKPRRHRIAMGQVVLVLLTLAIC